MSDAVAQESRLKPASLQNVDILLIRENVGGLYQGKWMEGCTSSGERIAEQTFGYTGSQIQRIMEVAVHIAMDRRGIVDVVIKDGGVPTISKLWRDCALEASRKAGIECRLLNVDLAGYQLIQHPQHFDVMVAPNLFGDILADLGGVLLGSRALSFSGNFSQAGAAVYQTNHGSALDIAGHGRANPIGQIGSLAMLLRESLGLAREASWIEESVAAVLAGGHRPFDVAGEGERTVGCAEMGERVAEEVRRRARSAE